MTPLGLETSLGVLHMLYNGRMLLIFDIFAGLFHGHEL
jgi:hypothetical protein